MLELKIAKGWAIFIYLFAPLLILLFGWLLFLPFLPNQNEENSPELIWVLAPISIGMIALAIVGLLDTIYGKVVVEEGRIYSKSTLSNRQLLLSEIQGFRIDNNYIVIQPKEKEKKKIKISTYFGKTDELIEWLDSQYPNLDLLNAEQEKEEILNDHSFGETVQQRESKLIQAHKTAKILNWIGGIVGVWTWFWTYPYEYAIILSIVIPIIALIVLKLSGGLIRFDEKNGSAYPTIAYAFLAPCLGLLMRAITDFNIFNYEKVWLPTSLITVIIMAVILLGNKEFTFKKATDWVAVISASFIAFAYGFGTIITLNCFYDNSEPKLFTPKVLEKRISSGKSRTYYIKLTPWGLQKKTEEVSVSKELYNQVNKNDVVNLYYFNGLLEIPWFTVEI
jgi:hypothetical protein